MKTLKKKRRVASVVLESNTWFVWGVFFRREKKKEAQKTNISVKK